MLSSGPVSVWFGETFCETCGRFVGYNMSDIEALWPFLVAALPPHALASNATCPGVLYIEKGSLPPQIVKYLHYKHAVTGIAP